MGLTLLKQVDGPWEQARGLLRTDLTSIETAVNTILTTTDTRWTNAYQKPNPIINVGAVGGAYQFDLSTGLWFLVTLTANVTFSFRGATDGLVYRLFIRTGAGGFTGSWASDVRWPGGTAPTLTVTANKIDVIDLKYAQVLNGYFGSSSLNY